MPEDIRRAHEEIDWRTMAGMKDRLIHGYFGVDYKIVWDVVATKLSALGADIQRMVEAYGQA